MIQGIRKTVCILGVEIALGLGHALAGDPELIALQQHGATASRINIVLLAEGYRAEEHDKFVQDATAVLQGILGTEPMLTYQNYFNAFGIFVESTESGSDHPGSNVFKDTYFSSSFSSFQIQRLLTIPPNDLNGNFADGQGKVNALLQQFVPEYDLTAIVVNDPEYGGSGGSTLVVSTHPSSAEIGVHEMGHSYAHLGDEYGDAYPGYPDLEEPNTTQETQRDSIKWKNWIEDSTPIPTPELDPRYEDVIGLFEGAHYHDTGWYRPKDDCKMQHLGIPFCSVCSEALVLSTYRTLSPVDSFSPADSEPLTLSRPRVFNLRLIPMDRDTRRIDWTINTIPIVPEEATELTVAAWMLPSESNELVATVTDSTTLVRTDLDGLLKRSITWNLIRGDVIGPALQVDGSGDTMELSWDAIASAFTLEATDSASSPDWRAVGGEPIRDGTRFHQAIPAANKARFFRLHLP